ncbi:MAG: PKD domain-containing protein, partial [Deltaproteobacteria bacterium]|nr:PKD domain-containing protein [Deltaproteobacteria bacterium]
MKHVEFYLMRCCRAFVLAYLLLVAGGHDSEALGKEYTHTITYGKIAETQRGYRDFVQVVFIKVPIEEHRPVYARLSFPSCDAGGTGGFSGDRYAGARFRILGGDGACSNPALKKVAPSFEEIYSGKVIVDKEYGSESFREKPWMTMALLRPEDGELIGTSRYYKLVVEGDARADGKPFLMAISRDPDGNCPVGAEVFCYSVITRSTVPGCVFLEKMSLLVDGEKGLEIGGVSRGSAVGIEAGFWADMPVRFPEHDDWLEEAARLDEGTVRRTCSLTFKGGAYPGYGTLSVTDQEGNLLPLRLPVYCGKGSQQLSVESLSDCGSFAFDATRVKDPYGCSREFIWKFGDGTAESGTTVVHHYEVPGNYDVSVHVADVFEVVDSVTVDRFTVAVNHPPIASAGADLIGVPGTELTFDGSKSRDPDGHVSRYEWDFGEGQTMSGKTVTHIYPEPNFYTATLVVEDDSGSHCNTGTDTCRVWINDPPVAEIGGGGIASPGEKITFSGGKSVDRDGKIIGYRWDFGDGATAGGAHVTHAYREAGTYEVTLGVTDDSGAANKTAFDQVTVFVNSPPIAEAGSDKRASVEEGITFDGSQSYDRDGELVAYHWDFGDGSGGEGVTVVHTYQEPGRYGITLTVKDNSQSTSDLSRDRALVIINSPPVAEAGPDQTVSSSSVCFDGTKSFDADGALIEYRWDFGDGSYGEGVSPVHVYSNPGSYTVRLTVDDDSMTSSSRASDEATVRVNCFPIADAGPDLVGAPGCALGLDGSASVDPDGEITAYKWNLGDGTTAFGRVVIHHYSRPGTYSALLTVHDNSGHDAAVGFDECRVLINRAPVAIAGKDLVVAPGETVCLDGSRSFDPDGAIASYQWEFSDDEGAADSAGVSRSFPRSGVFSATLTVVDDSRVENSAARDTVVIRVNDGPEA